MIQNYQFEYTLNSWPRFVGEGRGARTMSGPSWKFWLRPRTTSTPKPGHGPTTRSVRRWSHKACVCVCVYEVRCRVAYQISRPTRCLPTSDLYDMLWYPPPPHRSINWLIRRGLSETNLPLYRPQQALPSYTSLYRSGDIGTCWPQHVSIVKIMLKIQLVWVNEERVDWKKYVFLYRRGCNLM